MPHEPLPVPGRRIVVVGTSGSGKTTLAATLSRILGIPHVEMDSLHWDPNWTPAPPDVFGARVSAALSVEAWVIDGNYSSVRNEIWPRADTLVWLDYSLPVALSRVVRRTVRRVITRQVLWNGNREPFSNFFARDSVILWTLTTHRRRRRQYASVFAAPHETHLTLIRLGSPRIAKRWLAELRSA